MSLPDDLLLNCIARISRLYYPTLSLVSKTFRSLLASLELYKTRSLLKNTESCLYVCLQFGPFPYTYRRKPDQTLTLATVPVPHSRPVNFPGLMVVGSDIYHIDKSISGLTRCRVSVLDCKSHTLRDAPTLPVKLREFSANVVDEKIYVVGTYKVGRSSKESFEVFDTKEQVWHPCNDDREVIVWNSEETRQALIIGQWNDGLSMLPKSSCEIDNVLFGAFHRELGWDDYTKVQELRWYDTKLQEWRKLKGLEGLPYLLDSFACVRLADYGGKLALLWEELANSLPDRFSDPFDDCLSDPFDGCLSDRFSDPFDDCLSDRFSDPFDDCLSDSFDRKSIWCAVITLEKLKESCDIFGKVEWCQCMLTVPKKCDLVKALAVTV